MSDGLRDVEQAAAWLNIPPKTLRNLVSARRVPFTRPAGTKHVRFTQAHLDAIVAVGEEPVVQPSVPLHLVGRRRRVA